MLDQVHSPLAGRICGFRIPNSPKPHDLLVAIQRTLSTDRARVQYRGSHLRVLAERVCQDFGQGIGHGVRSASEFSTTLG